MRTDVDWEACKEQSQKQCFSHERQRGRYDGKVGKFRPPKIGKGAEAYVEGYESTRVTK